MTHLKENKTLTEKEWCYLSEKGRTLFKLYLSKGLDADLAVELAVMVLGDEQAYELE